MKTLVTGANGHLGFNLVGALKAAGHDVRGSVRSLADESKTARIRIIGGVELVEAEVGRVDQLRAAMDGVDVVFHTAAVYAIVRPGHEAEIVDASVRGAENAIRAAADARVGKVVLTSSTVTLPLRERGAPPVDESDWTDDLRIPYFRAKVEGERVAWRVARELGIDLVTILPGGITGPGFARNTPTVDLIEAMMRGLMRLGVPDYAYPMVDVRDVAAAHLLAAQQDCSGRFIACNDHVPTFREMIETMHAIDPRVPLPLMTMPDWFGPILPLFDMVNSRLLRAPRTATPESIGTLSGRAWNFSNRRIRELLGWRQSVSMEQSLRETMDAIRELRGR